MPQHNKYPCFLYLQDRHLHESNSRSGQKHRKLASSKLNNSLTMDVDVDNDLQCPICLELYTYPIILPCSHVLCRAPCAEHLFDFNFIRCPVCRDNCYISGGIGSLPRVIALENIIERYKNEQKKEKPASSASATVQTTNKQQTTDTSGSQNGTDENLAKSLSLLNSSVTALTSLTSSLKTNSNVKCQNCKSANPRRAKKYCVSCNLHYCASCLRASHPNKEPFTSHVFTECNVTQSSPVVTQTLQSNGNIRNGSSSMTTSRKNTTDSYCSMCTQPYCSSGPDRSVHSGHPVVPIEHAYSEFKVHMN